LLIGVLGAEVAKNLTLAGIKSLTVVDHLEAQANSANFLIPHIGIAVMPYVWQAVSETLGKKIGFSKIRFV